MRSIYFFALLLMTAAAGAQNEQDAMRYSVTGPNGGGRFTAMGGAFGALGADLSCAANNPAGLALFRKGEINFSASVKTNNTSIKALNSSNVNANSSLTFNQFGFAAAWKPDDGTDRRNVLAFTNTQILNLNQSFSYSGYTNGNTLAKDMTTIANSKDLKAFNGFYEGLGYGTYLLEYDSASNRFFSFMDPKRTVRQTRTVENAGRVNDINISFAHAYKDLFYFGGSLGIPVVSYTSTTTHTEADDRDSMRVTFTSANTYTSTYTGGLPVAYSGLLGFDHFTYKEYFRTAGSGLNIKLGAVVRPSEFFRFGVYYHSPTYYKLNDTYYNSMNVTFDAKRTQPISQTYPATDGGGYFSYKINTPSRFGLSAGFIFGQQACIGIDYEAVNYKNALLKSSNSSDFVDANNRIENDFRMGHNFRIGAELNVKPVMIRVGYTMIGSVEGRVFSGNMVTNIGSIGLGFRSKSGFYLDLALIEQFYKNEYVPYRALPVVMTVKTVNSSVSATIGFKF